MSNCIGKYNQRFYERNTDTETDLFDFAYVPDWYRQLEELEGMVLPEPRQFKRPSVETKNQDAPIWERYIHIIYRKQSIDYNSAKEAPETVRYFHIENECACFHTGLYTERYKAIYAFFDRNKRRDSMLDWYFRGFCDEVSPRLKYIEPLPERPHYHTARRDASLSDIHDILYTDRRPLNRGIMAEIAGCRFVENNSSIVFQGYSSLGKIFFGCAVGREACRQQYRVRYIRLPELLSEYADKSLFPGGKNKVLNKYAAFRVLILDEWINRALSKEDIEFIFELSERRFDSASTVFRTLYQQKEQVNRLGGGVYAESMVERFAYNVTWIETGDVGMRQIYAHA